MAYLFNGTTQYIAQHAPIWRARCAVRSLLRTAMLVGRAVKGEET